MEVEPLEKKSKRFSALQGYADDEEINLIKKKKKGHGGSKIPQVPKWVYRVSLILLAAVLALAWWFNRENLTMDHISDWIQSRFVGMGVGDGFPVSVPGGETETGNFISVDQEAVAVSNTSLTAWNSTGKQTASIQHACSQPALKEAAGRFLVYSIGGTSYQISTHTRNVLKANTTEKIMTADICSDGRFALVTQSSDYACRLTVYLPDGSVQYEYDFSQTYITAVSLNGSGTMGFAAGIQTQDGALVSQLYVFDFNQEEPVYTLSSPDNMILQAEWGSDGKVCAVGDRKALWVDTGSGKAETYDYGGQQVTACQIDGSRLLLSLSSYSVAGACRVLEFRGTAEPVTQVETDSLVKSVSMYGETLAYLSGSTVQSITSGSGESRGTCSAGGDARAIALQNESNVYLLGVSEVRQSSFQ